MEDDYGNLWITTNKGISKYNVTDNSFYNYDVNSGLQSNTFMENVSLKDTKGTLYFGGIYGLNIFHPDSVQTSNMPSAIITGLKISGQEIIPGAIYDGRKIETKKGGTHGMNFPDLFTWSREDDMNVYRGWYDPTQKLISVVITRRKWQVDPPLRPESLPTRLRVSLGDAFGRDNQIIVF